MQPILDALNAMAPAFAPLSSERLTLLNALGRFAARDVHARQPSPAFDNSAMDGYAVRAQDIATVPATLAVIGESRAGGPSEVELAARSAIRVFTGGQIPRGADAVVAQEDTEREGDHVVIRFAAPLGHHVRPRGRYLDEGATLIEAHAEVTPGRISLIASQGVGSLEVFRKPRVAILSTGDELRDLTDPPRPGSIFESNAYLLSALVTEAGGSPRVLPSAGDNLALLTQRVHDALQDDLVITTGGVSVGDHDHVREAFKRAGVTAAFWKVRMKPGKPLAFGTCNGTPVVGLPGNPVSAFATFKVFVEPGIRAMLGSKTPHPARLQVTLAHAHRRRAGRTELARASLHEGQASLYDHQGSGNMVSIASAEALVVLPHDRAEFAQGDRLTAIPLSRAGVAAPWID